MCENSTSIFKSIPSLIAQLMSLLLLLTIDLPDTNIGKVQCTSAYKEYCITANSYNFAITVKPLHYHTHLNNSSN